MSAMLPAHWRGPKLTLFCCALSRAPFIHWRLNSLAPRLDSVIEIARLSLARDYIAELKRLSNALVQAGDDALLTLNVSMREAFQVEGRDQIPLRDLAAKARVWRDTQSQVRRVASPRHGRLATYAVFPRRRSRTRLRPAASLLRPPRPCSIARSPRPFGQKRSQRNRN